MWDKLYDNWVNRVSNTHTHAHIFRHQLNHLSNCLCTVAYRHTLQLSRLGLMRTVSAQNATPDARDAVAPRLQRQDSLLDLTASLDLAATPTNWSQLLHVVRDTDISSSIVALVNDNIGVVMSVSSRSRLVCSCAGIAHANEEHVIHAHTIQEHTHMHPHHIHGHAQTPNENTPRARTLTASHHTQTSLYT